jgi:hypothetical protein
MMWAALLAASSTAAAGGARPEVAIFPTAPAPGAGLVLRVDHRRAFSRALAAAARRRFVERRWRVVPAEATDLALAAVDRPAEAAARLGARRDLTSSLRRVDGSTCEARATLRHRQRTLRALRAPVTPCTLDRLLVRADDLGREIARGPRFRPRPTTSLSSTPLPDLHLSAIPDIRPPELTVTTTAPRPLPLDRALAQYRETAIRVFRDPAGRLRFARRGRLIGECGLRRAASAPLTRAQREFCEGNGWIWSLVGVPAGGLLAAASYPELERGHLHGFVGVSVGVISAVTAAALALTLSELGHAPESGAYASDPEVLKRLAEQKNAQLRRELGLTAAETRLLSAPPRP